ncbi:hypothetical protein DINM_006499 [Dirofilaria immitis]|nr:hypothetical protein [Dirofilaria immitis]
MSEQVLWQGETEEVGMSKHYGSVEGDTRKETPTPMPSSFLLRGILPLSACPLEQIGSSSCVWLQTLLPVVKMCVIHSKPMNHPCATFPSDASLCGNSDKKLSLMTSTLETDLFNNEQCQCDIHHGRSQFLKETVIAPVYINNHNNLQTGIVLNCLEFCETISVAQWLYSIRHLSKIDNNNLS